MSTHYKGNHARRICTVLKVVRRDGWVTRDELIAAMKVPANGDQLKLLRALEDEGLLESRKRAATGKSGPAPVEFSLSRAWRDE